MLEQLQTWDKQLLVFLNQFHTPALDTAAYYLTKTEFWIPLYAYLLFLVFRDFHQGGWWVLAGIVIALVITDQVTSSIMKPYFMRLRPSHEPSLEGIIHIVNNYRGGLYGFASSHAANTLGTALFFFLLFRDRYRYVWLLFVWAAVMSYTRIYLGVHYPGDILTGWLVGFAGGIAGFKGYQWLKARYATGSPS